MSKYRFSIIATFFAFLFISIVNTGCSIYSFSEKVQINYDSIKTVRIQTIVNNASYQNPQLTPNLTERLKQKVRNQTKLVQTNNDNADLDISGTVTEYGVSTSGVTNTNGRQQSSLNRLSVTVHVIITNQRSGERKEHDVSRSFDFSSNLSLQAAEAGLLNEMIRNLSDEIFNRLFSDW
jgi:outer membrane lipopolysaccharide assembly protein LptE/RlpB